MVGDLNMVDYAWDKIRGIEEFLVVGMMELKIPGIDVLSVITIYRSLSSTD